ncbi:MBG-2 domain-containing protein, partial [Myroides guanonis]
MSIDGFNQDVIADGIGTAASSTTSDVDGVSFSFKSINWMLTSTSSPQTKGFPVDGIINSEATMGLKYQLKDYSDSNSIQLNGSNSSIISNVSGSVKAKKLFMLVTSGSGSSNLTCKVTFEDNSAMVFLNIFISDWYSGTLSAIAFHDFGRIGRMNNVVENPASNPRLYEVTIDISNIYQNKSIKSIQFVREPNSSGVVNIFAVSAQKYIDCDNPLAVTISDIIGATAKVNLVLPSVLPLLGYEYEVRTSGVPGSGAVGLVSTGTISFDATTHKLTGLPPLKQLYFYIRSNCGAKGVQDWMGPISFLTNCEIPKIISTSSQNACKNSSAYLSANYNSGIVRWYDSPTSEIPLAVGNSFATPNLSSSKSYWVEAMASEFLNSSGGKTDLHSSANDINTFKDWGIIFDLNQDVILKSTDVFVGNYGTLNIAIRDNQGKELFSTGDISVNTADINKRVTIPLKFKLAAGTGYRMVIKSFSDITLYRDSPVSFPYKEDNGIMTVTSGFFDGFTRDHYYYFYNIIYEKECISPRTEVIANVIDIAAPIANTPVQTFCASSDPTLNSIGIQGSGIQWYATETGSVALPHTTLLEDNTTYYASQTIGTCTSETRTAVKVELKKPTLNVAGLQSDFYYGTDTQSIMTMIDSLLGNYPLTWFRDEIGGNSIPAPDIATLNVGQYLYLISANINGCESHRIKVVLNAMPAELTVSVNAGQTKLYGNVDPELTYTVSGLKNNEQASNVLTGTLSRDTGENVGMYSINQGSLSAGINY